MKSVIFCTLLILNFIPPDSKVDKRRTERLKSIAGDEDVFDENVLVLKKNQPERGRRRER